MYVSNTRIGFPAPPSFISISDILSNKKSSAQQGYPASYQRKHLENRPLTHDAVSGSSLCSQPDRTCINTADRTRQKHKKHGLPLVNTAVGSAAAKHDATINVVTLIPLVKVPPRLDSMSCSSRDTGSDSEAIDTTIHALRKLT